MPSSLIVPPLSGAVPLGTAGNRSLSVFITLAHVPNSAALSNPGRLPSSLEAECFRDRRSYSPRGGTYSLGKALENPQPWMHPHSSKRASSGTSLVVQWLRLGASTGREGGEGSTPSCGTKIPHAVWHGQIIINNTVKFKSEHSPPPRHLEPPPVEERHQ